MAEKLTTGPEPSEKQKPERSAMEEAAQKWQALKASIEEGRQAIKAKGRNLLGLNAPHAENGQTIPALPSEVPPVQPNEVIPSSYGNIPIETSVTPSTPETVQSNTQEAETPNPEPAPRVIGKTIELREIPSASSVPIGIEHQNQAPIEEKNELLPDFHIVQAGETLYGIADKYKINLNFLLGINEISDPSKLEIKQKIFLNKWAKIKPEQEELPPIPNFHTVVKGDTLSSIAKRYGGLTLTDLYKFNGLTAKSTLQIGQILALRAGIEVPEQQKKPEEEKKLAEGLTKKEHIALILETCGDLGVTNLAQRAYILATAEHESDYFKTMSEYSKGRLKKYGKADETTGQAYYGRGYVQLTWKTNYEKYDGILRSKGLLETNQSIVTNPELVKNPKIAAFILVHGMMNGSFGYVKGTETRARLGSFINDTRQDWEGARQTVNGSDKKKKIADRAKAILETL